MSNEHGGGRQMQMNGHTTRPGYIEERRNDPTAANNNQARPHSKYPGDSSTDYRAMRFVCSTQIKAPVVASSTPTPAVNIHAVTILNRL
mmetsp:Transcript_25632/g.46364  ORF Transcript_25632/g.46364 Transcript_25632/m.46364 type:complete len:89 (+) Transcript_25632:483-749(+)